MMKQARYKISYKRLFLSIFIVLSILMTIVILVSSSMQRMIESAAGSVLNTLRTKSYKLTEATGFVVENIHISGLQYTSKLDILNILNVNYGDNMFKVDTETLLLSLKKIGWIEQVTVQKRFPNTIDISIREYKPYALWQYKNQVCVVTETGVVIPNAEPKHFSDLLLVVGDNANLQCKGLVSFLTDYAGFKDMVLSAQYVQKRRWRLYFASNVIVDLPESGIGDALHLLYNLHQKQKILERDVEIIDIRVPNKIVFKGVKNIQRTKKLTQQGV